MLYLYRPTGAYERICLCCVPHCLRHCREKVSMMTLLKSTFMLRLRYKPPYVAPDILLVIYRYISKRVSLSPSRGIVFHVVSLSLCLSVRGMVLKVTGRIVTKFYWMCGSRLRQNPIILGMIWMVLRVCHPECILVALTDIFCCRSAEGASKERDKHLFGDSRGRRSILEIAHLSYSCFYIHIHHWRRYVLYGVLFYFVYSFFLDDKY